ncbi:MAG: hypothetical protein FD126_804 [Elusimicrobia bacterium]|nr:MAG: hypothetical protein FD126_804 [Elusimicrobiota bacterium]
MKSLLLTLLALSVVEGLAAAPAAAGLGVDTKFTSGPSRYRAGSGSVAYDHPSGFEGSAGASASRSETSSTTLKTYNGRVGFFTDTWSAGLSAGLTPKADLYRSFQYGTDASWTFLGHEGENHWGLTADFAYTRLHHEDEAPLCPNGRKKCLRRVQAATRLIELTQNDLTGGLRARGGPWTFLVSGTASLYDQDVELLAAPRGRTLPGLASTVEGYPSSNLFAKVGRELGERFWAWSSASRTAFHLGEPAMLSLELGAGASLGKGFELTLSGNRQKNATDPVAHYVSAGLAWRLRPADD